MDRRSPHILFASVDETVLTIEFCIEESQWVNEKHGMVYGANICSNVPIVTSAGLSSQFSLNKVTNEIANLCIEYLET